MKVFFFLVKKKLTITINFFYFFTKVYIIYTQTKTNQTYKQKKMKQNGNGRINLIQQPNTTTLFNMYDKIPTKQPTSYRNPTTGIFEQTPLIQMYFSKQNIVQMQQNLRIGVYKASNQQYLIGDQDEDTLKIIMRSIYLQHSVNLPNNINEQVQKLNKLVLDYCIDQVYGEAQGYMKYLYDASNMYIPMEHPVLAYPNDKELEFKRWF